MSNILPLLTDPETILIWLALIASAMMFFVMVAIVIYNLIKMLARPSKRTYKPRPVYPTPPTTPSSSHYNPPSPPTTHTSPSITPPTSSHSTNIYTLPTSSTQKPPNPYIYRPSPTTRIIAPIKFYDQKIQEELPANLDLKDLVDPLTGVPLQTSGGLYQCKDCKVFYQKASYEVIRAELGGRCVSCRGLRIVKIEAYQQQRGRNAEIGVVTLENYRDYEGQVVIFRGDVKTVRMGKAETYAVMFEDRPWVSGFKMVVFRGKLSLLGGPSFLFNLVEKSVKVRGLIIKHETFGYEIIISDPAMILEIE